ncbi:MAG: phosphomannomutase/phosphoglucomutase [Clostridia bacterium]|nr:phosphomannomutase/phosphoglucomutase [Clostridia bacterium]
MQFEELKKLKSGTDVRGVAVSGDLPVNLTDEAVELIVNAFIKWLSAKFGKQKLKIAIGNDSRISAERIVKCASSAILSSGCDVVYTGLSSTPSMFILLKKSGWGVDASIMVTASHMPYDRNGLKFFTPEGGLDGKDVEEILRLAANGEKLHGTGSYEEKSFMDEYSQILVNTVESACGKLPLKGKKIIVDAGNGAGGFFAEKVLKPLGADTDGSQFLEPDGYFPNHIPNPEDKVAIASISSAVIREKADLGIIFDTDVDRAACVDFGGGEINRNALIALVSAILLKEKAGTIVTDSVTSDGLTEFIEALGGKHLRFKRGYKNVIDKCKELNESGEYSPLAIETSGHAAFKENYYLDDGAYLITKILISLALQAKDGKSLTSLIATLKRPVEEDEVRITFNERSTDFKKEGAKVIEDIKEIAAKDANMILSPVNHEGVRINFKEGKGGWLLLRMSVHDPVMPINFESNYKGGNKAAARTLLKILENYPFLELKNLKNFTL